MSSHSLNSDVMIVYELYELIIGLKCRKGFIWCTDGSFVHPLKFEKSGKEAYGYVISDNTVVSLKKSESMYKWSEAKSYCTECSNGGKYGYCPDKDELYSLYESITSGKMRDDLMIAGIYGECDYREESAMGWGDGCGWNWIWSSSEYEQDSYYAYSVGYDRCVDNDPKPHYNYVIPFFKF